MRVTETPATPTPPGGGALACPLVDTGLNYYADGK